MGGALSRDDLDALADQAAEGDEPTAVAAQLVDVVAAGRLADPVDAGYAYLLAAEIHEEAEELDQALDLVERALDGHLPRQRPSAPAEDPDQARLRACRARLRLQLGNEDAPLDPYPEEEDDDEWGGGLDPGGLDPGDRDRSDLAGDAGAAGGADAVLLVWPRDAYEQVDQNWPEVLEPTGAVSWEEYRRYCQALITDWTRRGRSALLQVTGDAGEFEEWLAEQDADPFGGDLAALASRYGSHLAEQGDPVELPPGPGDPCWCGSGAGYARCCRPLSP